MPKTVTCPECKGNGFVLVDSHVGTDKRYPIYKPVTCPTCKGKGTVEQ